MLGHCRCQFECPVAVLALVWVFRTRPSCSIISDGRPIHHVRGLPPQKSVNLVLASLPALAAATHFDMGGGVSRIPEKSGGGATPAQLFPRATLQEDIQLCWSYHTDLQSAWMAPLSND